MLNPDLKPVFLVWGNPRQGPRSRVLARALGLGAPQFISAGSARGIKSAPFRYARQMLATFQYFGRTHPRLIFVQSPPSFAVWASYLYGRITGGRYIVDAHNGALEQPEWTRPRALYRHLARSALLTIVTNRFEAAQVQALGGDSLIFPDPPTTYPTSAQYPLPTGFSIAIVGSYSPDEPLNEILAAAAQVPDVHFYVTGDTTLAPKHFAQSVPPNVFLTHYLADDEYYSLLANVHAVMCLCTRMHTWQGGAGEGFWLGKPLIVSDMEILREYFTGGAVFVSNTLESIRQGILEVRAHPTRYEQEICELQVRRRAEGTARLQELTHLIHNAMGGTR